MFSFEAGRKTPTGPGVYAFKCRRAEKLFNLLQVRVMPVIMVIMVMVTMMMYQVRVREQGPDRSSLSLAPLAGLQGGEGPDTAAQSPVSPLTAATLDPGSPAFSFPDSQVTNGPSYRPLADIKLEFLNFDIGTQYLEPSSTSTLSKALRIYYLRVDFQLEGPLFLIINNVGL